MRIRHVKISRFRGIEQLEWTIHADLVCLIGPGDSRKTTILDALTYTLSSRWALPITDADFYRAQTDEPICIEVTVVDPPAGLMTEPKYGLYLRGWSAGLGVHDGPEDDDERGLTIRLRIDETLEPLWTVFTDALPEGKRITAGDRALLGVFRLDDEVDRHLGWGRGSALPALSGDMDGVPALLADSHRAAREAVFHQPHPQLVESAGKVAAAAANFGVMPSDQLQPGLDPAAGSRPGGLILHDGPIPLTGAGLATRRLVALAVQHARLKEGSILLVDEVEHGLEPHRLINVLQRLKAAASEGQVFLTTHSPGSIAELSADQLHVVRDGGRDLKLVRATDAFEPPEVTDPQALVRACPEALLARRILVGEGPTEAGFFRGLALERWEPQRGERIAAKGSVCIDGGGDPQCIHRARGFAKLGYPTALLMDTDTSSDRSAAITAGVKLIEWAGGTAIEQRIALDIPAGAMAEFVKLAVSLGELEQSVRDAVASRLGILKNPLSGLDPIDWMTTGLGDQAVRVAIGAAARDKKWFKTFGKGEALGRLVARHLDTMAASETAARCLDLERFAYGDLACSHEPPQGQSNRTSAGMDDGA